MNFIEVLTVAGITTCIVAPITFFVAMFIFAVGVHNNQEEYYKQGFKDGQEAKENDIFR
jgi:hypothetical protein